MTQFKISDQKLPIIHNENGSFPSFLLWTMLGLAPVFLRYLLPRINDDSFILTLLNQSNPMILAFISILMIIGGLSCLYKKSLRIDLEKVSYQSSWFFFLLKTWQEPLKNFKGVYCSEKMVQQGKRRATILTVELVHQTNPKMNLQLYQATEALELRNAGERFAKLLQMSMFVLNESREFIERKPEELDLSVATLIKQGKLTVQFQPTPLPNSWRLKVKKVFNGHDCQCPMPILFFTCLILFIYLAFESFNGLHAYNLEKSMLDQQNLTMISILAAGLTILWILWDLKHVISIRPDSVEMKYCFWGLSFAKNKLNAAEIEDVSMYQPINHHQYFLQISSDRLVLSPASTLLQHAELTWIRNCILHTISS